MTDLETHIGSAKTLIVTSSISNYESHLILNENVFVYNIPQEILFRHDPRLQGMLHHHIFEKNCSQIIYAVPFDAAILSHLEKMDSFQSSQQALQFNLSVLLRDQKDNALRTFIQQQMMLELHVIDQCRLIMDFVFVKKKVEAGDMQVKGVVTELNRNQLKSIFLNGIPYNDLLTLN